MGGQVTKSIRPSDLDVLLNTLGDQYRREVLRYFECHSANTATLNDLVAHIQNTGSELDEQILRIRLHHTHLPKLDRDQWINYDPQEASVEYRGKDDLQTILDELLQLFAENR